MAMLERAIIKDNTLMPGEWYGGQLHIAPLASQDGPKSYTISVAVGSDRHEIQISQGGAQLVRMRRDHRLLETLRLRNACRRKVPL